MKSVWIVGKENIEIKDIKVSNPINDEVLVKRKACEICGTDLHFYHDFPNNVPTLLGY